MSFGGFCGSWNPNERDIRRITGEGDEVEKFAVCLSEQCNYEMEIFRV